MCPIYTYISHYRHLPDTLLTLTAPSRLSPIHRLAATWLCVERETHHLGLIGGSPPSSDCTQRPKMKKTFHSISHQTNQLVLILLLICVYISKSLEFFNNFFFENITNLGLRHRSVPHYVSIHASYIKFLPSPKNLGYVDGIKPSINHSAPHHYIALGIVARPVNRVSLTVHSPRLLNFKTGIAETYYLVSLTKKSTFFFVTNLFSNLKIIRIFQQFPP